MDTTNLIRKFYKQHSDEYEKEDSTMLPFVLGIIASAGTILVGVSTVGKGVLAGIEEIKKKKKAEKEEEEA